MAKINEIIQEIEVLLGSNDLSSTPRGRNLAQEYADVCSEVNDSLEEVRTLFMMGAYVEARRLNAKAKPPLTERFLILNFPRRQQWVNLCQLYGWAIPVEMDAAVVDQLLNPEDAQIELTIDELQNQWRRIIRDGSLREKLLLARKIYALDPSEIWKSNLLNVERPWINEVRKAADDALADGRLEDLSDFYTELVSPELLQKTPEVYLQKYQAAVAQHSRNLVENEKIELLNEIASCYAAMKISELEAALARWAKLETNPLFAKTGDEEIQIREARTFLLEQQAAANIRQMAVTYQNKLEQQLNENGNPRDIERLYRSLQQLDQPIKPLLQERMRDFFEHQELTAKRRHIRRCFYWGFTVLVIAGCVFGGIVFFQQKRDLEAHCEKIRAMLTEHHYEDALRYCEDALVDFPKSIALKNLRDEAKTQKDSAEKAKASFDQICQRLKTEFLIESRIFDPRIKTLFEDLERLSKNLPAEKVMEMRQLRDRFTAMREKVVRANDVLFRERIAQWYGKWNNFLDGGGFLTYSTAEKRKEKASELDSEGAELLKEFAGKISEDLYEEGVKKAKEFMARYNEKEGNYKAVKQLFGPRNASEYFDVLAKTGSSETNQLFRRARWQLPGEAQLFNLFSGSPTEDDFRRVMDNYPAHPFFRDLKMRDPALQKKQSDTIRENLRGISLLPVQMKLYELVVKDAKDQEHHFYFKDPAADILVEKDWAGQKLKAVRFSYVIAESLVRNHVVYRVNPGSQGSQSEIVILELVPGQKAKDLPATLKLPVSVLQDPASLKLAPQYAVIENLLNGLKDPAIDIPDVARAFQSCLEDKTITNPYAKAVILKQLLALLPELPEDDVRYRALRDLHKKAGEVLDAFTEIRWQNVEAVAKNQAKLNELQKRLTSFAWNEFFGALVLKQILLEKSKTLQPRAIGVFYLENEKWKLYLFPDSVKPEEYLTLPQLIILNSESGEGAGAMYSYAFKPQDFAAPIAANSIDDSLLRSKLYNGQLVYNVGDRAWNVLFEDAEKELEKFKLLIPEDQNIIIWPEFWPQNRRNIKEFMQ